MKYNKTILVLILTLISIILKAQHTTTIYFNKSWKVTNNHKEAEYYRKINFDPANKPVGLVRDYYMNGNVQYEAEKIYVDTIDPHQDTTVGIAKWYSKKGLLTRQSFFANGKLQGEQKKWFDTGELKSISNYENGKLEGDFVSYYQNGNYYYKIKYKTGAIVDKKCQYYTSNTVKCEAFFDEFQSSEDPYNWRLPNGNGIKSTISQDTGLYIQNNSSQDALAVVELPFNAKRGFGLEMYIKKDSGEPTAGYGLVYDYKDENNYSYFLIRFDGFYLTGRKSDGNETENKQWMKTKKLAGNNLTDKLGVRKVGVEMHYYLNGDKVAVGKYTPFTGSSYGVLCQKGDQSILLKTLFIYQW